VSVPDWPQEIVAGIGVVVGLNGGSLTQPKRATRTITVYGLAESYSTAPVDNGHSTAPLKKSDGGTAAAKAKAVTVGTGVSPERERGAGKRIFRR
jgi:hypothetical protein